MTTTTTAEKMAAAMCWVEMRGRSMGLDAAYAEVERTWRRHIPEANQLLEEMYRCGLVVEKLSGD